MTFSPFNDDNVTTIKRLAKQGHDAKAIVKMTGLALAIVNNVMAEFGHRTERPKRKPRPSNGLMTRSDGSEN